MRKLGAFNFISLDGYFEGPGHDIGWHRHGGEESAYSAESLKADNVLLFGRVTYEMMAGYWPTPMAKKNDPVVAAGMNKSKKYVLSRTLKKATWNNTTILAGKVEEEVLRLKNTPGHDLTILGSGSIITVCAEHGLIDEYQFMLDPVALGSGTPIFKNISRKLDLTLISTRTFKSGVILLTYRPLA